MNKDNNKLNEVYSQCAKFLKDFRISRRMNQEEIAKLLNVTQKYISHIEVGRNKMPLLLLKKIVELYSCDFTDDEKKIVEDIYFKLLGFSFDERYDSMGNFISYFRIINDINQTQLANSLGFSRDYISQIVLGKCKVSISFVEQFLNVYDNILLDVDKSQFLILAKINSSNRSSKTISNLVLANNLEDKSKELLDMKLEKGQVQGLFIELANRPKVLNKA